MDSNRRVGSSRQPSPKPRVVVVVFHLKPRNDELWSVRVELDDVVDPLLQQGELRTVQSLARTFRMEIRWARTENVI